MKIVSIKELQQRPGSLIDEAQRTSVVLTRRGRPVAVLRGVGGRRMEDVIRSEDDKFWNEIEAARSEPGRNLTQAEVEERFGVRKRRRRSKP
jgi:prevent-host-death family protein